MEQYLRVMLFLCLLVSYLQGGIFDREIPFYKFGDVTNSGKTGYFVETLGQGLDRILYSQKEGD